MDVDRSPRRSRCLALVLVALLVATAATPLAGTAAAASSPVVASPGDVVSVAAPPSVAPPRSNVAAATVADHDPPLIQQRQTFTKDDVPGRVTLDVAFDLPPNVREFEVRYPQLATGELSLVDRQQFTRVDETTLRWTGSPSRASLTFRLDVSTTTVGVGDRGVERDGWAFATAPDAGYSLRYTGTQPRLVSETNVSGTGFAGDRMAFMGPHTEESVVVDGERTTFVVGDGEDGEGGSELDLERARSYLRSAPGAYDFGVRHDRVTVFVLPYDQRGSDTSVLLGGESFGTTFWVTAADAAATRPENAFAHEYVHTRVDGVGNGSAAWLTEAVAEYYGYLSSLNAGIGDYESFRAAVVAPSYAPNRTAVVLAEQSTWEGGLGDYEKGAHVLAALDAEIRVRTDGEYTLYDVLRRDHDYDDYAAFRAAVVEVTGEPSLGGWLDGYVRSDALPTVADDPTLYVLGPSLDPDGDTLSSGEEADVGTNPFAADTDDDGLGDAAELDAGTDPTAADTDDDGIGDAAELDAGTDPTVADTDGDGVDDGADAYPVDASRATETAAPTATDPNDDTPGSDEDVRTETAGTTGDVSRTTGETGTVGAGFGAAATAAALGIVVFLAGVRWSRRQNRQ